MGPGGVARFRVLLLLKAVLGTVERDSLQAQVVEVGAHFMALLKAAAQDYPDYISNLRGVGTIIAFDCSTPALRDDFMAKMRNNGVLVGVNGTQSIRFRPPLTFGAAHLEEFRRVLEATLKDLRGLHDQ